MNQVFALADFRLNLLVCERKDSRTVSLRAIVNAMPVEPGSVVAHLRRVEKLVFSDGAF